MKPSVGTLLRRAYERARAPLAYFLVFIALGLKYFESKYSSEAIFLALALTLLPVIFEIHRAVTTSAKQTAFRDMQEAMPRMREEITEYLRRANHPMSRRRDVPSVAIS